MNLCFLYDLDKSIRFSKGIKSKILNVVKIPRFVKESVGKRYYVVKEPFQFERYYELYSELRYTGHNDVAILMTGVWDKKNDFSINTLKYYRLIYPDIKIFLSTWKGHLSEREKKELASLDVVIIENKDTYHSLDKGHMANQIMSGRFGIEEIKKLGVKYVLKTRTDVRFDKPDFIDYLKKMIVQFPSVDTRQNGRLVSIAFDNNILNIPFHMSDLNWFGSVDEIEKMFEARWRTEKEQQIISKFSNEKAIFTEKFVKLKAYPDFVKKREMYFTERELEYCLLNSEEIMFHKQYAAKYIGYFNANFGMQKILELYWKFIRDYCIVVDQDELGGRFNKTFISKYPIGIAEQRGKVVHSMWIRMQQK